jgi:nucleobase transporter 1/2
VPADGAEGGEDDGPRVPPFAGNNIDRNPRELRSWARLTGFHPSAAPASTATVHSPPPPPPPAASRRLPCPPERETELEPDPETPLRPPLRRRCLPGDASPPPVQGARTECVGIFLRRESEGMRATAGNRVLGLHVDVW